MFVEVFFIGPIDRCRIVVRGTVFDLLTINIEIYEAIRPVDLLYRTGRNQDLFPWPPVLRIDDKVTDAPIDVVDEKVLHMTDFAVAGMDMVPFDRICTAKVRIVITSLNIGNFLLPAS
jgi:hypothetical protein